MRLTLNLPAVRLLSHPDEIAVDLKCFIDPEQPISLAPITRHPGPFLKMPPDAKIQRVEQTTRGGGVILIPDHRLDDVERKTAWLLEQNRVRYLSLAASEVPGWFVLKPLDNERSPSRTDAWARLETGEVTPAKYIEKPRVNLGEGDVVASLPFAKIVLEAKLMVEQFEGTTRLGRPPAGLSEAKQIMAAFEALAERVLPPPKCPSEAEVLRAVAARLEANARAD